MRFARPRSRPPRRASPFTRGCARRWWSASGALIGSGDYVVEGRDIGTVVSPDAPLKVFLTASDSERARRRAAETDEPVERVRAALASRDDRDSRREHGALRRAADSTELDTTGLDVEQVVDRIVAIAQQRGLVRR